MEKPINNENGKIKTRCRYIIYKFNKMNLNNNGLALIIKRKKINEYGYIRWKIQIIIKQFSNSIFIVTILILEKS